MKGNELTGRGMTRQQVLAGSIKDLIFEINDFIVDSVPRIKPFLESET
jgi:hypothetical protein